MDSQQRSLSIRKPNLAELPTTFEVVEDGRRVVRPDVMGLVTQLATLAQINKMRKLEESKVPTGSKSYSLTIPDTTIEFPLGTPWISFSLVNNGAGSLYVRVNTKEGPVDSEAPIASGATYTLDFDYPIITKFYFKAASGTTAAIKLYGEQGKWR